MKGKRGEKKPKEPVPISEVLDQVLKSAGLQGTVRAHLVLNRWKEIAGEAVAAHADPVRIEEGVLYLKAENGAWRSQLHFMKGELIRKINDLAEKRIVKSIVFTS